MIVKMLYRSIIDSYRRVLRIRLLWTDPVSVKSKVYDNCLLGRLWIHEAGAVTSTLHQKLKFVKNKKLVVIGGEKALLVSHLSFFYYIDAEDKVGTPF